jgi:hypothetical protein
LILWLLVWLVFFYGNASRIASLKVFGKKGFKVSWLDERGHADRVEMLPGDQDKTDQIAERIADI